MSTEVRAGSSSRGQYGADERQRVINRAEQAGDWLEQRNYRGWDPYDGLESPLARLPVIRRHRLCRFAFQQTVKRSPINLRPVLRIPPGRNPVTLALAAQGHAYLGSCGGVRQAEHVSTARQLVRQLAGLRSDGWSGACWGYDFDWQARRVMIPARAPTLVATGMVTNALFEVDRLHSDPEARSMVIDALPFLTEDLQRTQDPDGSFCWSYSPFDAQVVLNATMKGARLCVQVASLTGDSAPLDLARRTCRFVAGRQRADGSWPYAEGDERSWADNFHTGYVLDCMRAAVAAGIDDSLTDSLDRGFAYYRDSFFGADGAPLYYPARRRPIDATACAQSLLTLCTFNEVDQARRVGAWTTARLSNDDGSFAYRLGRWRVDRTVFARWSVAWMFCGLGRLGLELR